MDGDLQFGLLPDGHAVLSKKKFFLRDDRSQLEVAFQPVASSQPHQQRKAPPQTPTLCHWLRLMSPPERNREPNSTLGLFSLRSYLVSTKSKTEDAEGEVSLRQEGLFGLAIFASFDI